MARKGVSEVLGAVLLSLIAAVLGTIIVVFALLYSNTMINTLSKPKCSFSIVYVIIKKEENSKYELDPIVYNSGDIPCKIVQAILIVNGSAFELKSIDYTIKPYTYKLIQAGLEIDEKTLQHSVVTIRLVSSDGTFRDYTIG
jgi:hypothetical protein